MSTAARVTVTRPAGPDGPTVLAVYQDSPVPLVAVPLTPARVLRLCRGLLVAVEPDEIDPLPAPNPVLIGARACQLAACATPETRELAAMVLARGRFPKVPRGRAHRLDEIMSLVLVQFALAHVGNPDADPGVLPLALQILRDESPSALAILTGRQRQSDDLPPAA